MAGVMGPHEGIEFDLHANSRKDIIYFHWDCIYDEVFEMAKAVRAETLAFENGPEQQLSDIFYRPGFHNLATELLKIMQNPSKIRDPDFEDTEKRIGRILGYSEEDIETYLAEFRETQRMLVL